MDNIAREMSVVGRILVAFAPQLEPPLYSFYVCFHCSDS